jgi:hypothetical protein
MSRFRPSRNYVSGKVVFDGGPVDISGDLVVSGSVTANEYNVNVINTNVTHIDMDGSTKFGDTPDDTHQFTGSVFIDGPLSASTIVGFGQDYQTAISVPISTTTSTTFQTKIALTTPSLTGTYRVGWTSLIGSSTTTDQVQVRLYNVTDGSAIGPDQPYAPNHADNRVLAAGFAEVVFAGASKTIEIQFRRRSLAVVAVGIEGARIEIWRAS